MNQIFVTFLMFQTVPFFLHVAPLGTQGHHLFQMERLKSFVLLKHHVF